LFPGSSLCSSHKIPDLNISKYFNSFSGGETLKHNKLLSSILLSFSISTPLYADSVLVYELKRPSGETVKQTISIDGRWLRLETEPRGQADYILMDTGRQIKFDVYDKSKSFQATRMGKLYWPKTAAVIPRLKPLRKPATIAGARCQQVNEIIPSGETVVKHCMATTAPLGLNAREMITLTRLFMLGRRLNVGWPAVATQDERQVSVSSLSKDGTIQQFVSAWHGNLPYTKFKIPNDYKRISPDLPDPSVLPKLRKKPIKPLKPKDGHGYNQG
jgi:hypothetical protein